MITLIGNAHIDPVWLWQWREGYHEVKATFRSALDRMEENPDFVFTCACACYYAWVEENDPEMFEEIRRRVKEGRWGIVGGMWIQPDMNTPSGESLVRQTLLSQRYFKEKFGMTATVGYNVDSFGHNAMVPEILKEAGMNAYVWMRPGVQENAAIPEAALLWTGLDGTTLPAYRIMMEYTRPERVVEKIEAHREKGEQLGVDTLCFYGVGNHGGGPTRKNLREIDEYRRSAPHGQEAVYGTPMDYFKALKKDSLPVWKGELQHHASGCYSTHSRSKKLHREAENALLRMEKFAALSGSLTGHSLREAFVRQAWEDLLFNEFHDLLGGCALPEALEDMCRQLCEALSIAEREENAALQKIAWKVDTAKGLPTIVRSKEDDWKLWGQKGIGTPIVVFNPHDFEAEDTVCIRRPLCAVEDAQGRPVPVQRIRASRTNGEKDRWDSVFRAKVPAMGYRLYWAFLEEREQPEAKKVRAEPLALENEFLRLELDPEGGLPCRLLRKDTETESLTGASSLALMDLSDADTWAHNLFRFEREVGTFGGAKVEIEEEGPVRAVLRSTAAWGASSVCIRYVLYAGQDQVEMQVRLDLREKHKMLKFCVPTPFPRVLSEIPYGVLERGQTGEEDPCQRFVALVGPEGGLALLNDGKYSYSARDGEMRMTLSNTSAFADHYGQAFRDASCRYMDQGEQEFRLVLVPFSGKWEEARLNRRAEQLNQPFAVIEETYHRGPLPSEMSGISVSHPGISVPALKRAEDGSGYVLRAVETLGQSTEAEINLPLLGRIFRGAWKPFEIKTLFLPDDPERPICRTGTTEMREDGTEAD